MGYPEQFDRPVRYGVLAIPVEDHPLNPNLDDVDGEDIRAQAENIYRESTSGNKVGYTGERTLNNDCLQWKGVQGLPSGEIASIRIPKAILRNCERTIEGVDTILFPENIPGGNGVNFGINIAAIGASLAACVGPQRGLSIDVFTPAGAVYDTIADLRERSEAFFINLHSLQGITPRRSHQFPLPHINKALMMNSCPATVEQLEHAISKHREAIRALTTLITSQPVEELDASVRLAPMPTSTTLRQFTWKGRKLLLNEVELQHLLRDPYSPDEPFLPSVLTSAMETEDHQRMLALANRTLWDTARLVSPSPCGTVDDPRHIGSIGNKKNHVSVLWAGGAHPMAIETTLHKNIEQIVHDTQSDDIHLDTINVVGRGDASASGNFLFDLPLRLYQHLHEEEGDEGSRPLLPFQQGIARALISDIAGRLFSTLVQHSKGASNLAHISSPILLKLIVAHAIKPALWCAQHITHPPHAAPQVVECPENGLKAAVWTVLPQQKSESATKAA